jgi:MFS-type transporter involved in bile tolerance (Atg22 family)
MPVSSPFIKSKETVPSAACWMLVMGLPMNLRPSAAAVKSVAAGDDSSVRLLLTACVSGSV